MKTAHFLILGTLTCSVLGCGDEGVAPVSEIIEIGALISFSGDDGATGAVKLAALEVAVEDANEELADQGVTIDLNFGDSQSDPNSAAILMNSFLIQNHRIIVGPNTSGEVAGVKEMIGASNSLLISPGSTSLALAEADDHIIRLAPNDSYMVAELVDLMWARGHRYLVLINRADSWGNSVAEEVRAQFTQKGGTVISSHDYWSLRASVIREILEEAAANIDAEAGIQSLSEVAIHLTCLNEGSLVFETATEMASPLGDVDWFGSDGFVQDEFILENATLAEFAIRTNYTAPIFGVTPAAEFEGVVERIEEEAGMTAGTYDLLTYDAMRIAARTVAEAGTDASYQELETALGSVLEDYQGILGQVEVDAMGDRVGGSYAFYTVQQAGGSYQWILVSQ